MFKLFLPASFIVNIYINQNITANNSEAFSIIFYVLSSYIIILILESFSKGFRQLQMNYYHNIEIERTNKESELEFISIINSLIHEDQIVLKRLILSGNQKVKASTSSEFISSLINNRQVRVVPNSQRNAYTRFSSYDVEAEIILDYNFYLDLKQLYDEGKILQDI